ncbi:MULTISPECIES: 2-amino-4-hydroxy-6-hydroxymethyldihydropteridine diphosphokinase [Exiguobacterium]|uniref:2-amino-4-hydroxy-6-hydroxymethyldihydropteridine diphosphokinase n=1 Tax=Exiguobacterium antarcticum TaxID=132920 RepID=A0ABT6R4H8_9BACL|nr:MULTISPECIES: 2-amino-4-hydroxy-6-hydroxymethyldihydropteridine diphosphokinase [Exiguobacterium]MCT4781367.1 2-amino-4-hydroxy-6-hydroxymethyldihydropteridine diphosphokinase [Exiguobacterium soli]MDI3235865.1 2-amino-4-hydroxy-6-hydroxymethyldihydropteridine diphosphokinase [Exiguobacterium antarcticum]
MNRAYIALGSNIGDKAGHLQAAIDAMRLLPTTKTVRPSSIYETAPVGYVDQDLFYNMVVELETTLSAEMLLEELQRIEQQEGRKRLFKNGPRTLDLDIVLYNEEMIQSEGLTVPHPRMQDRAFVLAPLRELNASHIVPGVDQTVGQLYVALPEAERADVRRIE